jgi:hypothetical protein
MIPIHDRGPSSRVLVALSCAMAFGCSTPRGDRVPESQAALAQPEPDPGCWGTVQDRLLVHGIQEVTVRISVDRTGTVRLVQFLSPDLGPVAEGELRSACESCTWKPGLTDRGAPAELSVGTFVISSPGERR